ncbi:MAG: dienelactone hydrolase family protein [Actinomycetota bacterium]
MCFDPDSHPPLLPVEGGSLDHRPITLTAGDGNTFAAYEAYGEGGGETGVVVLPDVRGLYVFYEELAVRLAEAGHDAVAIDYFGRTAGRGERGADFPYQDHVPLTTYDGVKNDVAAAVAKLRQNNPRRKIFTMGFCFGGSNSWHQACNGHGLAGVIGFYGKPDAVRPSGARSPIDSVTDMACPVLALMGGDDPGIPAEVVATFEEALTTAGVEHEIITYPGAPHSFFDRGQKQFAAESADAWERVLQFLTAHR